MNEIKDDVAKTIKNVLETFTVQYTKAYVLSIVRFAELEAKKMPKDWQLEARPRGVCFKQTLVFVVSCKCLVCIDIQHRKRSH